MDRGTKDPRVFLRLRPRGRVADRIDRERVDKISRTVPRVDAAADGRVLGVVCELIVETDDLASRNHDRGARKKSTKCRHLVRRQGPKELFVEPLDTKASSRLLHASREQTLRGQTCVATCVRPICMKCVVISVIL